MTIDPELKTVLHHKVAERPHPVEDLAAAVQKLKGEPARREELFQKSFADNKSREAVMSRKFDELLKQAKADPNKEPPKKDIDWD